MILILAEDGDAHADYLENKLRERGADRVRFNPACFPNEATLSLAYSPTGECRYTLRTRERRIELDDVNAVYNRRPEDPVAHEAIQDSLTRAFVAQECRTLVYDAWQALDCVWLPARRYVIQQAQFKAAQLRRAAALGLEIPPTLFSNDPEEILEFYRQHNGSIISKLAGNAFYPTLGQTYVRYTEVVSHRDIGHIQATRYCPMIFQAYVPKRLELRITVVGQAVFPAEIHSQFSHQTRHDWRRYDMEETPYFPHELPPDLEQRLVQLVRELGLCYGAIDMVLTPDGRYVFLEINPNGQYLWIEKAAALPISDAICDFLMAPTLSPNQPADPCMHRNGGPK
jgi:glutathione synthase/RimK-type ligase-like ATP-grasp enzyme